MHETHVIVFAKAPIPGQVKTRLGAEIGDGAAAKLAQRMLNETLACVAAAAPRHIELCCAPDARDPALMSAATKVGATLTAQIGAHLGERMANAFDTALARARRVILMGTDCPKLTAPILRAAARALEHDSDAVFVPALDGGYVLIGLRRSDPTLFDDIPWSTGHVMAETESRLMRLAWRWHKFDPLPDVDRPQDLVHVPADWLQ